MEQYFKILGLILENVISTECHSVTGLINGKEVTVKRKLTINSLNLLPTIDIDVYVDGVRAQYGCSGALLLDEDIIKINKFFIDISTAEMVKGDPSRAKATDFIVNI